MTILQGNENPIVTHSRGGVLACGVAATAAVVVYLNALHNPFVYDDHHTVVDNPSIARLGDLRGVVLHDVTRPLVNLSYAIDRSVWGPTPLGFHVTNVALHALNVVLLFAVARTLYQQYDAAPTLMAFAAALLFAVHPMMTEAVGYISGRSELLCGVFFLAAILTGRRWLRRDGVVWAMWTVVLWAAALASKEIAAMFPLVLVGVDKLTMPQTSGERSRRWKTVHAPLIALAALGGLTRVLILTRVEAPGQALVRWPYALVALDAIRRYTALLVSPRGQTIFHAVPPLGLTDPAAFIAIGAVGVMLWLSWAVRRAAPVASLGVLWFLLLLVPGAALTVLNQGEPMAEHRVYLASCGLFLAAGDGLGRLRAWSASRGAIARLVLPAVLVLVVPAFAVQTLTRNAVWQSPLTLWKESVDLAPTHYRPHLLLGEALQDAGQRDDAMEEFKRAIQLRPTDPTGYNKLGALYAALGRADEARQLFDRVIELDPRDATARRALRVLDRAEPRPRDNGGRR